MPRTEKTIEQREQEYVEKLVPEEDVRRISELTMEGIDDIANKLYDDVIGHAKYIEERNGYSTIIPGRELNTFTQPEHWAIYYYEHHKGQSGREYIESIIVAAIRPSLSKLANDMLWERGTSKYIETKELSTGESIRFAKPEIIDDMVSEAILKFLIDIRYRYNPFNNKGFATLTTFGHYNFQYSMKKFLGDEDQTSYKDNEALGKIKRIDDYFAEKGLINPSPTDYVYAAETLGINGISESLVDRLKKKKYAADKSIEDFAIPDNSNVESTAIKNETDRMVNIILDQIGEYDKFAKMALLAFMEYSPSASIEKRSKYESNDIKGKMKYVKEFFVEHYYPEEKYGPISVNTFSRLLEIAKEEFAYRSKQMGFFERDTIDGDIYGLNLDTNDYIEDSLSNIGQYIQEYNDDDIEYDFNRKYIPRYA